MNKVKIVHAVKMLHYLPLYIAQQRYLNDDFELELAPAPFGDKSAIDKLLSTFDEDNDIHFCVCDPMMVSGVYSATTNAKPVVIGQIVDKVPFWAINHKVTNISQEVHFARFNQIFSYPEPNTGYYFAKLIHDECLNLAGCNLAFRPEKPIDAELNFYLDGKNGNVVVEADILKIMKYQLSSHNEVVYSYPHNPNYQEFCFTGLITRSEYLASDEGSLMARKLIDAIQKSIYLIYDEPAEASKYAIEWFSGDGFTDEVIRKSLGMLAQQTIFPRSLVVKSRAWNKSIAFQQKVNNTFERTPFRSHVNNRIAKNRQRARLREQFNQRSWRLRDVFHILHGNWPNFFFFKVFPFAFFAIPLIFGVDLEKLIYRPLSGYAVFHYSLTTFIVILSVFGNRLSSVTRLSYERTVETLVGLFVAYFVTELVIVTELLKPGH